MSQPLDSYPVHREAHEQLGRLSLVLPRRLLGARFSAKALSDDGEISPQHQNASHISIGNLIRSLGGRPSEKDILSAFVQQLKPASTYHPSTNDGIRQPLTLLLTSRALYLLEVISEDRSGSEEDDDIGTRSDEFITSPTAAAAVSAAATAAAPVTALNTVPVGLESYLRTSEEVENFGEVTNADVKISQGSHKGGTTNGSSEDVTNEGGGMQAVVSSGTTLSSHGPRASRGKLRQCIPVLSVVKLLLSSTNDMFSIGMVNEKDVVLCTPLAPTICQMVMSAFAVEAAMAVERALALNSDRPQLPASTSIHVGVVDQEELLASVRTKIKSIRPFWAAASARVFPFSAPTSPRGETVVGGEPGEEAGISQGSAGGVDAPTLMNDVSMQDADIVASSINADVAPPVEITDFIPLKVLGKGSFAKVLLVRHAPSGQVFAMKVLDKAAVMRRQQLQHTLTERHVLQVGVAERTLTERHVVQVGVGARGATPVSSSRPVSSSSPASSPVSSGGTFFHHKPRTLIHLVSPTLFSSLPTADGEALPYPPTPHSPLPPPPSSLHPFPAKRTSTVAHVHGVSIVVEPSHLRARQQELRGERELYLLFEGGPVLQFLVLVCAYPPTPHSPLPPPPSSLPLPLPLPHTQPPSPTPHIPHPQEVRHPFLVPLRWALQSETRLFLILDFMPGGELFFHLKRERRFKDDRARLYAAELLLALGHLHSLGVIYRDLKPENILLDAQGHVRIADFGLAKEHIADNSSASTFCGTPEYLAPEVLGGKGHGRAVDWWSLGILLFEMVVGVPPFYDRNVNIMYNKIVNAPLVFPITVTNFYLRDLISKLLVREPSLRLGAGPTDAAEIMRHEFFRGMDWDRLYAREVPPPFVPSSKGMEDVSNFDKSFTGLHISDPLEPPCSAAPTDNHHGASKPTNAPAKAAQTSTNDKAPAGTDKVNGGKTGKVGAKPNLKIDTHAASGLDPLDNSLFEGFVFSPTKKSSATSPSVV
ncbi:unnamed protein product [Closterium sp. NIES-53]